jgi:hypothetical protein
MKEYCNVSTDILDKSCKFNKTLVEKCLYLQRK